MSNKKYILIILLALLAAVVFTSGCTDTGNSGLNSENTSNEVNSGHISDEVNSENTSGYKTVTDMRGVEVTIPEDPQRVIAMSRSLIDTTMYIFGKQDKIVGCSVSTKKTAPGTYVYNGTDYTFNTWIGQILNPKLLNTTNVGGFGGPYGEPNAETIAKLEPDLFILRDMGEQDENTAKFIDQLDSMGIPVVVLKYPSCYENPSVETIYDEVTLLGKVFGEEEKAKEIVDTMKSRVGFITERTSTIPDDEKKKVLYFGAPTWAKDKGGVGYAFGNGTIEVSFMDNIVNAENVYSDSGRNLISAEQMISLDPDVIILCTWSGHHPPRQLYDEESYGNIQEMRAIKSGEVYSLAATPCKSERLEFPVNLMIAAKAVYPEKFEDVDLETWIRDYVVELYGTDEQTTNDIMNAFMLKYLEIT